MRLFIDTWGWLVLEDRKDRDHQETREIYKEFREKRARIITTDYVLNEMITLLFLRRPFHEALTFVNELLKTCKERYVELETVSWGRFLRAWDLRQKFRDKPRVSFTDLTSFAIMQELKISRVLTGDTHFEQVGMDFEILPRR